MELKTVPEEFFFAIPFSVSRIIEGICNTPVSIYMPAIIDECLPIFLLSVTADIVSEVDRTRGGTGFLPRDQLT
jgi:hypothetical protein